MRSEREAQRTVRSGAERLVAAGGAVESGALLDLELLLEQQRRFRDRELLDADGEDRLAQRGVGGTVDAHAGERRDARQELAADRAPALHDPGDLASGK